MFSPDTMICLPTNRICAAVGELYREGAGHLVQTITVDPFRHSTKKVVGVVDTGKMPCVKVTLDDNSELIVTDETEFLMYSAPNSNTFKPAALLVVGDVLWSALGMVIVKSVEDVGLQAVNHFRLEGQDDAIMLVRSHKRTRHSLAVKVPFKELPEPVRLSLSKEQFESLFGAKSSEPPVAGDYAKIDPTEDTPTHTE